MIWPILYAESAKSYFCFHQNGPAERKKVSKFQLIGACSQSSEELEQHLIGVHDLRLPFDRLTVYTALGGSERNSHAVGRGCSNILGASSNAFTLCDLLT